MARRVAVLQGWRFDSLGSFGRRNRFVVDLPDNDGSYRDKFRSLDTSFRWRICELGISFCSNEVRIDFAPNAEATVATVTTDVHSRTVTDKIPIHLE